MDVHTATPEWAQELHAPARKQRFVQNVPALVELAQESGLMHITREHLDGESIEPPVVKQEATDLTRLLPRLKTILLEQQAKHAFTAFLIAEDAPDEEDMAALTAQVPPKKDALRERKTAHNLRAAQLAERAQECNEEYSHCLAQSSRITELEAKLVETKIKLARLRQQHPPSSRLTAARGEATAERQMTELIELNEHIDEGREQVEERSAKLKDTQKTAQQSATRKAELERELKAKKRALQEAGSAEDARVGELVEWHEASLQLEAVLSAVTSLERSGPDIGVSYRSQTGDEHSAILRFDDARNPRALEHAVIRGLADDGDGAADGFVSRNDPRGLVRSVAAASHARFQAS